MAWFTQFVVRTLGRFSGSGRARRPEHLALGKRGEAEAFFYLQNLGYRFVATNFRIPHNRGEIDLVGWDKGVLCFIEVKTRTAQDATAAEVAVDDHKRKMLRRLARQYVRQLPQATAPQVRFDVISVYLVPGQKPEFVHFEAAFGWGDRPDYEQR